MLRLIFDRKTGIPVSGFPTNGQSLDFAFDVAVLFVYIVYVSLTFTWSSSPRCTIRILKEYIEQQKTPLPETVAYIPALKCEVLRHRG
jgi:hypothetical protein